MIRAFAVALAVAVAADAAQPAGDAKVGERIAMQGAGNGITACATCHGARGEGIPGANFPRLAGQGAAYLAHQLEAYAAGTRTNPIMVPIAKAMSAEQREAVAAYYASLETPPTRGIAVRLAPEAIARARLLSENGDNRRGLQACANCHGVGGRGLPPGVPYLAGLDADYIRATLEDWRREARRSDPSGMMPFIAKRLSDDDIVALAGYFASLPPPKPVGASVRVLPDARQASGSAQAKPRPDGSRPAGASPGGGSAPGGRANDAPSGQGGGSGSSSQGTSTQGAGGAGGGKSSR